MLGKRGPQRGLFEADTAYGEFVGRDSFYGWLASQRGELFRDDEFAGLYVLNNGRPSVPPSLLATALVLQTYEGVSDEEAKQRADYDLRWKVALGVELDARPFAKSTLQEFRAQLIVHAEQAAIFRKSLELAKQRGRFRAKSGERRKLTVALDTTNILGRGATKDTYNLLADGIVKVARVLARLAGVPLRAWAEQHGYGRYVTAASFKGTVTIDWSDPRQRRQVLGELVADADRLLALVRRVRTTLEAGSAEETALVEAAGLLSRVLVQDVERRDDGPELRQGVADDRLLSVHDPEQRHGRKSKSKRFDGHKAAVVVDTDEQLITAVGVLAGNAQDHERALELVEQTEAATGCAVAASIGDCAYGDGETRQAFHDAGRTLVAKVPAPPDRGYFPKTAFRIDLETLSCTCPSGQTTQTLLKGRTATGRFHFPMVVCQACPLRAQCVAGRNGRTVDLHPQEALLQAARALQASPGFAAYRRRRQVVEHRIARLVQLGIRQARYVGRAKTEFQLLMAAAVANLTLLATSSDPPSSAASPALSVLALLTGLIAWLISRALASTQPPDGIGAVRLPQPAASGRQRTPLPTVLYIPGSRPGF
jgi:transposase